MMKQKRFLMTKLLMQSRMNIIILTSPPDNRMKILKTFTDLKGFKIFGHKYIIEKVDDEQLKLETQKEMPLELDKEKEAKFEESIAERTKADTKDMRDLESKESAEERRKKGQGLKILTPNRMLRTLPIS